MYVKRYLCRVKGLGKQCCPNVSEYKVGTIEYNNSLAVTRLTKKLIVTKDVIGFKVGISLNLLVAEVVCSEFS